MSMHAGPVGPLPRQLDIRRLAAAETSVEAVEPLTSFPRLTAQLLDPEGEVAIVLHFSSDEQRRWIIRGQVKAELAIPCQRCLQPMPLEIDAHFADRKSTRLNSSHVAISYAVFCLTKKKT